MRWCTLGLVLAFFSCNDQGSGSVEVFLRNSAFPWVRDADADYVVELTLESGRRQKVVIRRRVFQAGDTRTREVLSVAQRLAERPLPGLLVHLLQDSALTQVWGHWALLRVPESGEYLVVHITKVPTGAGGAVLRQALKETAQAADGWERLTTGLDHF